MFGLSPWEILDLFGESLEANVSASILMMLASSELSPKVGNGLIFQATAVAA